MKKKIPEINEEETLSLLDELDRKGGVNTIPEKPKTSLGKIKIPNTDESDISIANNIGWKILPFNNLPSLGISYPEDSEMAIRSAKTLEIRHWSTIDENDNISINDRLNFILEKCVSFKIKGQPIVMDWKDIAVIDRFFIIFRIHELTFPNKENQMNKLFSCSSCPPESKYSEVVTIKSSMLQLFKMPDELQQFYSPEHKAFLVESSKFDPFFICLPTLGIQEKIRSYIQAKGSSFNDQWFLKNVPYLIDDYRSLTTPYLDNFRNETLNWHGDKFMFVTKAVELLEAAKSTTLSLRCPKCDNFINQNIFTSPSFTIKNLFIVSTRLADLI